jgi:hypothetical protein
MVLNTTVTVSTMTDFKGVMKLSHPLVDLPEVADQSLMADPSADLVKQTYMYIYITSVVCQTKA